MSHVVSLYLLLVMWPHFAFACVLCFEGGLWDDKRSAVSISEWFLLSRARATLTVVLLHCSGKNVGKGRGWRQGGAAPSGQAAAEAAAADPAGRRLHSNGDCCGAEIVAESRNNAGTAVEQLGRQRQTPRQRRWVRPASRMRAGRRGGARQWPVLSLFLADWMQFLVEYEETLLVATARAGKQVQLFMSVCVGSPRFSGAESEESFKDFGKNREAMRLCREGECVFFFSPRRAKGVFWFWRFTHRRRVGFKHFTGVTEPKYNDGINE